MRLLLAAAALLVVLVPAAPASAPAGGLTATNPRGRSGPATPTPPSPPIAAIEDGARLRLRNNTDAPVTVPAGGGPETPLTVAPGAMATWKDTRTSPDGVTVPAGGERQWSLTVDVGGAPVTVTGVLTGEQPPNPVPWWLAAAALALAVPLLTRRLRRPDLALAGLGTAALAASVAHVTGSTLAVESAPMALTFLNAGGVNLLSWPLMLGGAIAVLRGRPAGVLAVCAGAALTAVIVLPDVTSFHRAVIPFAGPAAAERVLVAIALGLGAGVAVAGAAVLRTLAARATDHPPAARVTDHPPAARVTDQPAADQPAADRSGGEPAGSEEAV